MLIYSGYIDIVSLLVNIGTSLLLKCLGCQTTNEMVESRNHKKAVKF